MARKSSTNTNLKILSKDDILSAQDTQREIVEVPEWGGAVYVRGLTGRQRDAFEIGIMEYREGKKGAVVDNMRAQLVAWCVVDGEGNRVFTDRDVVTLGDKSAQALNRVFDVARRLSGMTDGDVEELAGN